VSETADNQLGAGRDSGLRGMREAIAAARAEEENILGAECSSPGAGSAGVGAAGWGDQDGGHEAFVAKCFRENERGDGHLFAALNRGRFVYAKLFERWLTWGGNHWAIDTMDLSHDAVETVAQEYAAPIPDLQLERDALAAGDNGVAKVRMLEARIKKHKTRVNKLRSVGGAKNCLEWAHKIGASSLAITGEELDQKPLLLPCKNCVIDLATGKVVQSRPDDYLLNAVPVEWKGIDEPCPAWEKFIAEIHQDDAEMIAFVRCLLGYAVTGLTDEHFIACFVGEGRNGKGTMFETIRAILGDLSWNVSPELILEQKNSRSSAGPSPDLISLKGRRMVLASETDESRRISGSKVKLLTGSDTINARAPHEKFEINFRPSHKLFLYTNHIPYGLAKDYALYNRLLFINYPLAFIDNPTSEFERKRDPDLMAKLAKEQSGILAWLVRGALEWKAGGGLRPPAKIRSDVDKLRRSEDTFLQFFEDRMERVDIAHRIRFSDIYQAYKQWYTDEVAESIQYIPSKKKISQWLVSNKVEVVSKGGVTYVHGLELKVVAG
jgi:putative DNA primase/helicase